METFEREELVLFEHRHRDLEVRVSRGEPGFRVELDGAAGAGDSAALERAFTQLAACAPAESVVDAHTLCEMSVLGLGILAGFARATRAGGGETHWVGLEPCLRRHLAETCRGEPADVRA